MALEAAPFVSDLNSSNPTVNDVAVQGDDHLRLIKAALKATFPTADHAIYLEHDRTDVASGATTDIGAVASNYVNITGTTAITALGTVAAGVVKYIRFNATLTLTYNATSVILPSAANITTVAGDHCVAISKGAGNWVIPFYTRASGAAISITDGSVTLAKMADMATASFLGRTTAATGVPEVLTATQATAILNAFTTALKGLVPVPTAGNTSDKAQLLADATWGMAHVAPDIILEDQKAQNTSGGTFNSGADRTRDLNTEVRDVLNICSIASNQFTISTAGTYYIEWHAPCVGASNFNQTILRDITGAADLKRGTNGSAGGTPGPGPGSSGQHVFTISGSNVFEIRHRCSGSDASGFGYATNLGTETYTVVKIWKIA